MTERRLSRAVIAAMPVAEFDERAAEAYRWLTAGAVDGEPAPPATRPAGHVFTREEVAAMSLAEFEANEAAIDAQLKGPGVKRATM